MTSKTGSTKQTTTPAALVDAPAGSPDNAPSTTIAPTVKSDGNDGLPRPVTLPTGPLPSDPTRTAHSVGASTAQPAIAPALLRAPERYEILNEHGRGGLGKVSRAHDRELGRDVAIKELISRTTISEVRFLREAMITARLEHPGIVPMYEAGRWPDGTPYYAMKLVAGRSLRDLIVERTTVDQRIGLLHHVIAVADAIAYAHGRNIIHRDLKPANVIVGDFGETIVIDWGLAKDLSASADEPTAAGSPSISATGSPGSNDLTATGAVLGTPSYMAPEQERGEHVDQRADVFAIGAMLWELCSLQRVPPTSHRHRHRHLRKAGIGEDLGIIIDKALDPDPARRYPDARSLAADLKAFKSGARISARSYSPLAILLRWTRRHKALAISVLGALAAIGASIVLHVRGITLERDRADHSEGIAREAQAAAETSLNDLTLEHAQLQLNLDPSAALDILSSYRGANRRRADQIRAEALGRGVARLRTGPHTDNVLWAGANEDGTILSIGLDGTINRTTPDGTSSTVVNGVAQIGVVSFTAAGHLLAYACDRSSLCLFDTLKGSAIPITPALRDTRVVGLSFSPDGSLLASMSEDAVLDVLDVSNPAHPASKLRRRIAGGADVLFLDMRVIVVGTAAGVEFVNLDGRSEPFLVPHSSHWDTTASEHKLAQATATGLVYIVSSFPLRVLAKKQLCHNPVIGVKFLPSSRGVICTCKDGSVIHWDYVKDHVQSLAQLEGHADMMAVSTSGEYAIAAGGNGAITLVDLETMLATSYKGHGFRITTITPPTKDYPFLISGDARGALRVWSLPPRLARVLASTNSMLHRAIFGKNSGQVFATSWRPDLMMFPPVKGSTSATPHESYNIFIERSETGNIFATHGLGDLVEIWSFATGARTRTFHTGQGSVSELAFVHNSDDFITAGRDGKLLRHTAEGKSIPLAALDQPIDKFVAIKRTDEILLSTANGALWRRSSSGDISPLRQGGSRVNRIATPRDRDTAYVGYADGTVISIDLTTWQIESLIRGSGAIRDIVVTDDGLTIAVATYNGPIYIGALTPSPSGSISWTKLAARANDLGISSNDLVIAACVDGSIWLYSIPDQRWLYLATGNVNLASVTPSDDASTAVVLDSAGRLIGLNLSDVRRILHRTSTDSK